MNYSIFPKDIQNETLWKSQGPFGNFDNKFHILPKKKKEKRIGVSENDKGSSKQLSPGRFVGAREGREIEKGRNKEGRKRRKKSLPKSQFHLSQRTQNPKKIYKIFYKKKTIIFYFYHYH